MDVFYHADSEESVSLKPELLPTENQNLDPSIYLKVTSILIVRAGLFLSHVSSVPSSNIQILIFQNIIDIAVNTVVYAIIGYLLAFGQDVGGFIGTEGFLGDKSNKNDFVEGWTIIIAVSGLLVVAIGDRISFFASLLLNSIISGAVFPIIIHWVLSESGWMRGYSLSKVRVSFKDYNYSCMIHMSGGFLAFISMLVLSKRLLRFKDMDVCSIPDNGPSLTLFGNFFMLIGFFGMGIPSEKHLLAHLDYNFYGIILTNMLLSAFGAIATTLLLTFTCPCEPMHKWTSMRSIQAGISGIAIIAGGADLYWPMASVLIGLVNGSLYFIVSYLVNNSQVEDYSNIIACHMASGFLGTLLPPVFGIRENFNTGVYNNFFHFIWQLTCDITILIFILIVFLPVMIVMDRCSILRSWDEDINHRRAKYAAKSIKNDKDFPGLLGDHLKNPTVNFIESSLSPQDSLPYKTETMPERVNVLFEKKQTPPPISEENREMDENIEDVLDDDVRPCSSNENPSEPNEMNKYKAKNEEFIVNYVINSKPMAFFEEISADSRPVSEVIMKDCGDSYKNPNFFDIRLVKGIRNISDSKLFQKFKGNWVVPKRRITWNRERELKVGSLSNIWAPGLTDLTVETEV